jgi:tetratricopeptide (TPR) repeat protein
MNEIKESTMFLHRALPFGTACLAAAILLSACANNSNGWRVQYDAAEAALKTNPPSLQQAEKALKAAVFQAAKNGVPEPQYAVAIQSLGEVLDREGKFAESQAYLLHAASLATATKMPVDENVRLLKVLENSYEQTKNYDQAVQVTKVLVNYVNTELSPSSPEYKLALDRQTAAKALLASQCKMMGDVCCHEKTPAAVKDKVKAETAAQQPAVAPGVD